MADIVCGDRVKFRVGRGYADGRVVNVVEDTVSIATDAGKILNRKKSRVERVTVQTATEAPCNTPAEAY